VVDPAGNDVEPGGVGELILRGQTTMKGSWNKPAETAAHLPEPHRSTFRGIQRHYLDQWHEMLTRLHPDLPPAHARVHLQAALTVVNDVARTPHLRTRPTAAAAVTAIGHAILGPQPGVAHVGIEHA
jgi:acyl-CoA synthetase (AMP-forming)/AMP-acid ligase II